MTGKAYGEGYPDFYYGTYKVAPNGTVLWTNFYPTPPVSVSVATSIAADSANSCYVTGYSPGTNSGNDIVTIKYGANGNQIWLQRYNGPGNGNDAGNAVAVDNNGNVYVAGYDTTTAGGTEMALIKYSPVTLQRQADGSMLLQAQGSPGESFDIQASADLQSWLDLGSVTADTNGLMQFDDTNAANYPARFYVPYPK
jgi:outer membrane protein assembly factor BamB